MNFKEEYKSHMDNVHLDDDFKNNLARKMNQKKPVRYNLRVVAGALAAVAMLVIVIGVGRVHKNDIEEKAHMKVGNVATVSSTKGVFVADKWYGDAASDEEIYEVFVELLQSNTLEKLYCSETSVFGDENVMDENAAGNIVKSLVGASATTDTATGVAKNYMAVFEGGEIVKFQMFDDGFIKLNDADTIFKIKK